MEELNGELLISEVEARPCLWDMRSENYSNRQKKKTAWEEIVDTFWKKEGDTGKKEFGKL